MNVPEILIVEDESIIAEDLRTRLRRMGYLCHEPVADADAAVESCRNDKPDIVLMDIMLRGQTSGIEATRRIQAEMDLPIVYLTSYTDNATVAAATASEPFGYLLKPVEDRELRITLQMALHRHRTLCKLRQMEHWMSTTLRSIGDGLIATDTKGIITYLNPRAEQLLDCDAEMAIGRPLADIFDARVCTTGEAIPDPVRSALETGIDIDVAGHTVLKVRGQDDIYIDKTASPIRDKHGDAVGVVLVFRDTTASVRAESELQSSEARLRQVIDLVPAYIYAKDDQDRFLLANRHTAEAFGSTNPRELEGLGPDAVKPRRAVFQHCLQIDRDVLDRRVLKRLGDQVFQDGDDRIVLDTIQIPFTPARSELPAVLGVSVDITQLRHFEEEAARLLDSERESRSAAESASRSKDEFFAALSHELRTPLMPVTLLLSAWANSDELPPQLADDMATCLRHIHQESRLIDDLLDVARVGVGKLALHREVIDLHEIIADVRESIAPNDGVRLVCDLSADDARLNADPVRIRQVTTNLLVNACKYTETGTIHLRTESDGDDAIRLVVEDTGCGIDQERLDKIFNAFEQGPFNTARRFGGLGLGLAIVRSIVDAHGGTIHAQSDGDGTGSCFTLTLPRRLDAVPEAPVETATAEPVRNDPPPSLNMTAARILLVEDHEPSLRVLGRLLKAVGHDVTSASSVAEATLALDQSMFDLLISDIGLPDGSGCDVMAYAREHCDLPGIALSGYGQRADIERSHAAGFARHLIKPINHLELKAAIVDTLTLENRPSRQSA